MAENSESHQEAPELAGDVEEAPTAVQPEVAENAAAPAAAAPAKVRLRDRAWSFRSLVAVAVATLLIGGAGGAAIVAATDNGHDRHPRFGRFADGPGRGPGGFGRHGGGPQSRNGPGQNGFGPQFQHGPNLTPNGPQITQPTPTPKSGSSS